MSTIDFEPADYGIEAVPSSFALAADIYRPPPHPYIDNPVGWVNDRLKEHLWSKQKEILESVRDHRKTAVYSCHGIGKDFSAARCTGWWIDIHPPSSTLVVTTGPTEMQVKGILWQELQTVHEGAGDPLDGVVNQKEWWVGQRMVGIGRKPSDYSEQQFQGFHRDNLLVVLDEAGGIPENLWEDAEKLTTADDVPGLIRQRILAIGNPDFEGSKFSRVCRPDSGWNVIHIGHLDTPNFSGEQCPLEVRSRLIGINFVETRATEYGTDSPTYMSQVLGLFPKDRTDGVVPYSWLLQCQGEDATARIGELRIPVELGVDVGGSVGGDQSVIAGRWGMRAMAPRDDWRMRTDDSEKIVDKVIDAINEVRATSVKVDIIGVGFGVYGSLRRRCLTEVDWTMEVWPVNVGESSPVEDQRGNSRFVNLKAEMWWELARMYSRHRRWDVSELDEAVVSQLTDVRWFETPRGRIQIESKDDVRRRAGRSPDDADALLLAFLDPRGVAGGGQLTATVKDSRSQGRR